MTFIRTDPGSIWRITFARPSVRNAVSSAMLEELRAALADAAADPRARVVLLAGEGPDFCAGADLEELAEAAAGSGVEDYGRPLADAIRAISEHPLPVVAAVHGAALGAGCQFVVAADLCVAAADARIGIPSSRLGVVMGFDLLRALVLSVGDKRASDVLLRGRVVTGEEAVLWGLVNEAVPAERLAARALEVASQVAAGAPLSVRASKRGIRLAAEAADRAGFDQLAATVLASEDLREGISAFRERREPEFRGR